MVMMISWSEYILNVLQEMPLVLQNVTVVSRLMQLLK